MSGLTYEKLQYIRDVYCMHPMIIDLLDEIDRVQREFVIFPPSPAKEQGEPVEAKA